MRLVTMIARVYEDDTIDVARGHGAKFDGLMLNVGALSLTFWREHDAVRKLHELHQAVETAMQMMDEDALPVERGGPCDWQKCDAGWRCERCGEVVDLPDELPERDTHPKGGE